MSQQQDASANQANHESLWAPYDEAQLSQIQATIEPDQSHVYPDMQNAESYNGDTYSIGTYDDETATVGYAYPEYTRTQPQFVPSGIETGLGWDPDTRSVASYNDDAWEKMSFAAQEQEDEELAQLLREERIVRQKKLFIVAIIKALSRYGNTTHRIEYLANKVAEGLRIRCHAMVLPNMFMITFGNKLMDPAQSQSLVLGLSAGMDCYKLQQVESLVYAIGKLKDWEEPKSRQKKRSKRRRFRERQMELENEIDRGEYPLTAHMVDPNSINFDDADYSDKQRNRAFMSQQSLDHFDLATNNSISVKNPNSERNSTAESEAVANRLSNMAFMTQQAYKVQEPRQSSAHSQRLNQSGSSDDYRRFIPQRHEDVVIELGKMPKKDTAKKEKFINDISGDFDYDEQNPYNGENENAELDRLRLIKKMQDYKQWKELNKMMGHQMKQEHYEPAQSQYYHPGTANSSNNIINNSHNSYGSSFHTEFEMKNGQKNQKSLSERFDKVAPFELPKSQSYSANEADSTVRTSATTSPSAAQAAMNVLPDFVTPLQNAAKKMKIGSKTPEDITLSPRSEKSPTIEGKTLSIGKDTFEPGVTVGASHVFVPNPSPCVMKDERVASPGVISSPAINPLPLAMPTPTSSGKATSQGNTVLNSPSTLRKGVSEATQTTPSTKAKMTSVLSQNRTLKAERVASPQLPSALSPKSQDSRPGNRDVTSDSYTYGVEDVWIKPADEEDEDSEDEDTEDDTDNSYSDAESERGSPHASYDDDVEDHDHHDTFEGFLTVNPLRYSKSKAAADSNYRVHGRKKAIKKSAHVRGQSNGGFSDSESVDGDAPQGKGLLSRLKRFARGLTSPVVGPSDRLSSKANTGADSTEVEETAENSRLSSTLHEISEHSENGIESSLKRDVKIEKANVNANANADHLSPVQSHQSRSPTQLSLAVSPSRSRAFPIQQTSLKDTENSRFGNDKLKLSSLKIPLSPRPDGNNRARIGLSNDDFAINVNSDGLVGLDNAAESGLGNELFHHSANMRDEHEENSMEELDHYVPRTKQYDIARQRKRPSKWKALCNCKRPTYRRLRPDRPYDMRTALHRIISQEPLYSVYVRAGALVTVAFACAAMVFNGTYRDTAVTVVLGLTVAIYFMLSAFYPAFGPISSILSAMTVSFLAKIFTIYVWPETCLYPVSLAAIIFLLPGWSITTAVIEFAARSMISGTVRFMNAMFSTLQLGFGLAIGTKLVLWHTTDSPTPGTGCVTDVSRWTWFITFPIMTTSFNILLGGHPRQWPFMSSSALVSFLSSKFLPEVVSSDIVVMLCALIVGLYGSLLARLLEDQPMVYIVTGTLILVPGGMSVKGAASLFEKNSVDMIGFFATVLNTAVSISVGLLVAKLIFPSKRAPKISLNSILASKKKEKRDDATTNPGLGSAVSPDDYDDKRGMSRRDSFLQEVQPPTPRSTSKSGGTKLGASGHSGHSGHSENIEMMSEDDEKHFKKQKVSKSHASSPSYSGLSLSLYDNEGRKKENDFSRTPLRGDKSTARIFDQTQPRKVERIDPAKVPNNKNKKTDAIPNPNSSDVNRQELSEPLAIEEKKSLLKTDPLRKSEPPSQEGIQSPNSATNTSKEVLKIQLNSISTKSDRLSGLGQIGELNAPKASTLQRPVKGGSATEPPIKAEEITSPEDRSEKTNLLALFNEPNRSTPSPSSSSYIGAHNDVPNGGLRVEANVTGQHVSPHTPSGFVFIPTSAQSVSSNNTASNRSGKLLMKKVPSSNEITPRVSRTPIDNASHLAIANAPGTNLLLRPATPEHNTTTASGALTPTRVQSQFFPLTQKNRSNDALNGQAPTDSTNNIQALFAQIEQQQRQLQALSQAINTSITTPWNGRQADLSQIPMQPPSSIAHLPLSKSRLQTAPWPSGQPLPNVPPSNQPYPPLAPSFIPTVRPNAGLGASRSSMSLNSITAPQMADAFAAYRRQQQRDVRDITASHLQPSPAALPNVVLQPRRTSQASVSRFPISSLPLGINTQVLRLPGRDSRDVSPAPSPPRSVRGLKTSASSNSISSMKRKHDVVGPLRHSQTSKGAVSLSANAGAGSTLPLDSNAIDSTIEDASGDSTEEDESMEEDDEVKVTDTLA